MIRSLLAAGAVSAALVSAANASNVVQTAQSTGQFRTLLAAAQAAGLADTLATTRNITVFAPTDAAFRRLPKGTVENLLKPENREQLRAILSYHVLPTEVAARQVPHQPTNVSTLNSSDPVRVVRRGSRVSVDNAHVVQADVKASNGTIHVINRV
ncbi:MAG: fasciclin domain-containing protein, partial [Beijerinckiaceae bacterium]